MPSPVLEVLQLAKRYGRKEALKGVSFTVDEGEIYGLIGPNGAGKTTTLRIIATLLKPSSGDAKVRNYSVTRDPESVRKIISYLPEESGSYPTMTGLEYLRFIAGIYYDNESDVEEAVERGVKIAGLGKAIYERTKTYSKGMKRRLQVARALMVNPDLALLDEPTSGIDIVHSLHLRRIIKRYAKENSMAILLSSHNILEVETLCDRIGIIRNGKIVMEGTPEDIKREAGTSSLEEAFYKVIEK